jgi:hypothetical protein
MDKPYITNAIAMCALGYSQETLHHGGMFVMSTWETPEELMTRELTENLGSGTRCDYSTNYSAGHLDDDDYLWEFDGYSVYDPVGTPRKHDVTLVILYYRPVGIMTKHMQRMQMNPGGND